MVPIAVGYIWNKALMVCNEWIKKFCRCYVKINLLYADISIAISCLVPATRYQFRVLATNIAGDSNLSTAIRVSVPEYNTSETNCSYPPMEKPASTNPVTTGEGSYLMSFTFDVLCITVIWVVSSVQSVPVFVLWLKHVSRVSPSEA